MDNERIGDGGPVIARADEDDWEDAMELAWRTFLKFEANEYGKEGTDNFLSFISGEELFKMFRIGEYPMAVAKDGNKIVGMAALRSGHHVSLLFVDEKYHHRGIATRLLSFVQEEFLHPADIRLTVNAAPYAVGFYKKVGFLEADDFQKKDGITYMPMVCLSEISVK